MGDCKTRQGLLIFNKYYSDEGQEFVKRRLAEALKARNVSVTVPNLYAGTCGGLVSQADFAVFWDKDIALARCLERDKIRVFNCADAIEVCDDKRKTYDAVCGENIPLIPTIFSPLSYKKSPVPDVQFLKAVESRILYPIVVKESVGSRGAQVYLAKNRQELERLNCALSDIPHQYQPLFGKSGEDIRVYTVGTKAVACIKRKNPDSFISNTANGGTAELFEMTENLQRLAEKIAKKLRLDFGAIDFLESGKDGFYFLEANSNAYFTAVEKLGVSIADKIAEYICKA